jgi:hemolysin III
METEPKRRRIKQPFSAYSHFVGALLSITALVVLLVLSAGRVWHVVSFTIYGASLIVLYIASTLYHSLDVATKHVDRLQRMDHIAIFLLIAGTYTPVCLVLLRGAWGWSLLGVEYLLAGIGIVLTILYKSKPEWLRVVLYIVMGWLALIAIVPLRMALSPAALGWLVGGGAAYSIGTIFFATNRPNLWPGKFEAHDLWHLFVLGGSICHFVLMLGYVVQAA